MWVGLSLGPKNESGRLGSGRGTLGATSARNCRGAENVREGSRPTPGAARGPGQPLPSAELSPLEGRSGALGFVLLSLRAFIVWSRSKWKRDVTGVRER